MATEEKGGGNVLIPTVPLLTPINGKNWSSPIFWVVGRSCRVGERDLAIAKTVISCARSTKKTLYTQLA